MLIIKTVSRIIILLSIFFGAAIAAPVTWIIPPTQVGDNTVSGTFTYDPDAVPPALSAVNITSVGLINAAYTVPGVVDATYFLAQTASVSEGSPGILIYTLTAFPDVRITLLNCAINNNVCTGGSPEAGNDNVPATLTPQTPASTIAPVPTLTDWAMIVMASLMAFFAMVRMRRN